MIRRYILEAEDSLKGFNEAIEKLDREWGIEELKPCDDCVSRKAVEKITWEEPYYRDALNVLAEVRDRVRALPSVQPQRPQGKWLDKKTTVKGGRGLTYGRYGCSVCKKKQPYKSDFCPNCGAEMGVENE